MTSLLALWSSDVVSTVINESSRTSLECALRSSETLFSPQSHLRTYINLYSSERSMKWPFPLNPRYAKNAIRNEVIYHFRVNSYHTSAEIKSIVSNPASSCFKSAVLRSTDLLVWNRFQGVFPFTIYCLLKSFTIPCEIWTIKRQQMAKMSDRVPNERLGTSRLSHVFLKIYPNDPTSKF